MTRTAKITASIVIALIAIAGAAWLRYPGKAPVKLPAASCDANLWQRVYEPDRLEVIEPCTAAEGRVVLVHFNADGDAHIGLVPDQPSVLNLVNATHGSRQLVAEIVCDHPPRAGAAKGTCAGYQPQIAAPQVGDRVRITGAYVTDRDNGWREIHPVSRIEKLP